MRNEEQTSRRRKGDGAREDPYMCIIEETYHAPCGHWGPRINSYPCAIALGQPGRSSGCWHGKLNGVARLDTKCIACTRVQAQRFRDPRWHPFGDISTGAWQHINESKRRRRFGFESRFPWFAQHHDEIHGVERRRWHLFSIRWHHIANFSRSYQF